MSTLVTTKSKNGNIHIRVSPDTKATIERAIALSGQSLTDFATRSLLESATDVIEREFVTTLSNRDRDLLLKMLDDDTKPSKGLRQAAETHRKLIIE